MASEIPISDLNDYKYILNISRDEYQSIIFYINDSDQTSLYLFEVTYTDERPHWRELTRTAALSAYSVLLAGGDFKELYYPGIIIKRDKEKLAKLH